MHERRIKQGIKEFDEDDVLLSGDETEEEEEEVEEMEEDEDWN